MGAGCDVTRLHGFNRALTALGFKVMSDWGNPGLAALMSVAKASGTASTFTAGFILGPRINAGGRIGRSDLGARLLSTDDPEEAAALAEELDALNVSRKDVERQVFEEAVAQIEAGSNRGAADAVVLAAGDGWHPGVVGIVAGRLRERYRKPAVVIGLDRAANVGKGSGRSQPGVNLGRAITAAYEAGVLLTGGGHAMAAGLSIRPEAVPELREFLNSQLCEECVDAADLDGVEIDAAISPAAATRELWASFQRLTPFGPGNPEPLFAAPAVRIEQAMLVRGGHVRCRLTDSSGAKLRAVAWRCGDTPLGQRLLSAEGAVHVVGRLRPDDWNGREGVEFEIEDVADPRQCA